ncbi:MAG TPA: hypothetical protein EYG09_08280 [Dehalococcoidia bacterium]|nr:hypothetical protein [Dehalococcoidia bacterium]
MPGDCRWWIDTRREHCCGSGVWSGWRGSGTNDVRCRCKGDCRFRRRRSDHQHFGSQYSCAFVDSSKRWKRFDFDDADALDNAALLELDCDVLIPAAIEGVITAENAPRVRADIVVEGANRPVTSAADEILVGSGKNVIPDILANAGGVVASYFEWAQNIQVFNWELERVNRELDKKMNEAYDVTKAQVDKNGGSMRDAAFDVAAQRVAETIKIRIYVG